jgi:hypothetical protein
MTKAVTEATAERQSIKQADKTYVSVDFVLRPFAVASRRITRGRGALITYALSGLLISYEATADAVTHMQAVRLNPGDEGSKDDKDLYERWFGRELALRPQYARCAAGRLQWTDSYR